jgi:hypothetical protein
MNIRRLLVLALLGVGAAATAEIVTLINAVETSTMNLIVPTASNGNLSFKPCAGECEEIVRVRLTPETTYILNGKAREFSVFRMEFYKLPRRSEDYALVSYDTKRNTVTSVIVGK